MKKQQLVIWGASGHALVVADIVRVVGEYEIVGFIDDINPNSRYSKFCGATILGGREQLKILKEKGVENIILGFGNCEARLEISSLVAKEGFSLATAIHPRAVIANDVKIGNGVVIVAGAVVNPGVIVGDNVIVNTCASVDHGCKVGDGVSICPGVHIGGNVEIGKGVWVGIGTTVKDRVKIGDHTIIGAGSVVVKDIPSNVVAYGVPASVRKNNL